MANPSHESIGTNCEVANVLTQWTFDIAAFIVINAANTPDMKGIMAATALHGAPKARSWRKPQSLSRIVRSWRNQALSQFVPVAGQGTFRHTRAR